MDKNSITGLAIIAVIMMVWLQFMSSDKKQVPPVTAVRTEQVAQPAAQMPAASVSASENFGVFAASSGGEEKLLKVDNDLFRATLSSKGATLKSLVLKKHLVTKEL